MNSHVVVTCLLAIVTTAETEPPLLLMLALDGFRHDNITKQGTPHLWKLANENLWMRDGLIPQFPTFTLPNFYSIATGLLPESHGLIANVFYDPKLKAKFDYFDFGRDEAIRKDSMKSKWFQGVPFWLLNERLRGRHSGCMFWPICDASVHDKRPTISRSFDDVYGPPSVWDKNLDTVLSWFTRAEQPINLALFYISEPDETEHLHGVGGSEALEKLHQLDAFVGRSLTKISSKKAIKDRLNLIILSDHGQVNNRYPDSYIDLMDVIPPARWQHLSFNGWSLMPKDDSVDMKALYQNLTQWKAKRGLKATVWLKEDTPKRYHYTKSDRIGPISIVPDPGYYVGYNWTDEGKPPIRGNHGYDNQAPGMRGIFIASGPSFKPGVVESLSNLDIYPAVNFILGLPQHESNGSLANLKPFLLAPRKGHSWIEKLKVTAQHWRGSSNSVVVVLAVILPSFALIAYFCVVLFTSRRPTAQSAVRSQRQPLLISSDDEEDQL